MGKALDHKALRSMGKALDHKALRSMGKALDHKSLRSMGKALDHKALGHELRSMGKALDHKALGLEFATTNSIVIGSLHTHIGWVINVEKSNFTLSQVATYMGMFLDTSLGLAIPSTRMALHLEGLFF